MSTTPGTTGGPAFPRSAPLYPSNRPAHDISAGMTLRQYAAIKLKVPDRGTDWLDAMITESNRDTLAAQAMQGAAASHTRYTSELQAAADAYGMADAMLKAGK